ncbi:putative 3-hydroxyisobutyrate dehydrogenase [Diplogelasinospora grovesii]|uniref:3-hydroxyisobutyrate dehydrogenase n=1 Tax=Diplogelasinospora grovesii TaxID=303347 RepID=A0AAN6NHF9_9PEZI|nr:putative 3-hydroxyisobutyrate dehydrogenase [Diplogelasinospora grovesii]
MATASISNLSPQNAYDPGAPPMEAINLNQTGRPPQSNSDGAARRSWWPWSKTIQEKVERNLSSQFSGKKGFKNFRRVYRPIRPHQHQPTSDPEHGPTKEAADNSNEEPGGEVFHQPSHKFDDVAVYLSPTNSVPKRLVVQASGRVLSNRQDIGGDWIRTKVRGNVPLVLKIAEWSLNPLSRDGILHKIDGALRLLLVAVPLQIMLAIPGTNNWNNDSDVTDSYTDHPGYHWDWPKYAVNYLDMAPTGKAETSALLDVRRRSMRPRKLIAKKGDEWVVVDGVKEAGLQYVFISYAWGQFASSGGNDKIRRMAEKITQMEGCAAYWLDARLVSKASAGDTDYDVYTMCDIVRGAARVAVMLGSNTIEARENWGQRMWTLPEGLLAPGERLLFCHEDETSGEIVAEHIHKIEMTATFWAKAPNDHGDEFEEGGSAATRILAEHFSGLVTLSRLELLPAAITALNAKLRTEFTNGSDLAYAVMGLLHYRIQRNRDTLFQNLARLSLSNDSDGLVERMICLLPKPQRRISANAVEMATDQPRTMFEALSESDQYETRLHHITPLCQVVGVAHEDETVILDTCRATHIRWKDFPQAVVQRNYGIKKLVATLFVAAGLWWLTFGVQLAIYYIPYWAGLVEHVKVRLIAWLVCGFLFIGVLLSAFSPFSVRRLFGGTVLKSSPNLVAFEGVMRIAALEKTIFGNCTGRLTYAPSATPFSRDFRHPQERRGTEPTWIDDPDSIRHLLPSPRHQIFTLVDMGELSVSIFSAERPPTVVLLCGREGGMLRAVLCSWRFESDCLYKETVVRMPSRVYEAATAKGWLKLCLQTQNQARRTKL